MTQLEMIRLIIFVIGELGTLGKDLLENYGPTDPIESSVLFTKVHPSAAALLVAYVHQQQEGP